MNQLSLGTTDSLASHRLARTLQLFPSLRKSVRQSRQEHSADGWKSLVRESPWSSNSATWTWRGAEVSDDQSPGAPVDPEISTGLLMENIYIYFLTYMVRSHSAVNAASRILRFTPVFCNFKDFHLKKQYFLFKLPKVPSSPPIAAASPLRF